MPDDRLKRGYLIPPVLLDKWEQFHEPSKDFSPSVAGAFLVWMALDPDVREYARKAACFANAEKAIKEIKTVLSQSFVNAEVQHFLESLSAEQKAQILSDARRYKGKASQTK